MRRKGWLLRELLNSWDTLIIAVVCIPIGTYFTVMSLLSRQIDMNLVLSLVLTMLGIQTIKILRDNLSAVKKKQSIKANEQQREAYRDLIEDINKYGAREATLFQYSGTKC